MVKAMQTTRQGGVSRAPYASLNLGDHVGDDPQAVAANRQSVSSLLPAEPVWLQQVHGTVAIELPAMAGSIADAAWTRQPGQVCVVMTADCLPILLCNQAGTAVAAIHAGWRGLCDGVIESTVRAMSESPRNLMAWLGPAITQAAFEVGPEVREAFVRQDAGAAAAFVPGRGDRWQADLYLLARRRLADLGVTGIFGASNCTYRQDELFFSYRRDGQTGRMASLIWIEK